MNYHLFPIDFSTVMAYTVDVVGCDLLAEKLLDKFGIACYNKGTKGSCFGNLLGNG